MKTPSIGGKTLTRRSFFKHGLRLSVLAFMGFGFTGRNNLATERITLSFSNLPPAFDRYTYVNRGIGTLVFPLRIGAPPEITRLTLVRGRDRE